MPNVTELVEIHMEIVLCYLMGVHEIKHTNLDNDYLILIIFSWNLHI